MRWLAEIVPQVTSDVSRFRLSSVKLHNHKVGYFDPLLWAVRVMICVATFCIGGKCSVVLCLKNRKYGGVSSLSPSAQTAMFCSLETKTNLARDKFS